MVTSYESVSISISTDHLGDTDFFSRCETGDFKKYIGNSYVPCMYVIL